MDDQELVLCVVLTLYEQVSSKSVTRDFLAPSVRSAFTTRVGAIDVIFVADGCNPVVRLIGTAVDPANHDQRLDEFLAPEVVPEVGLRLVVQCCTYSAIC